VAFVDGAAGMGKSRLVAELVSAVEGEGARVGVGHVTDIDEAPPFGAWSDAMRQLVRACAPPPADAYWPEELARLCPAVETAWGRHPGAPIAEPTLGRARLFESVAEALDWCQRTAPTLVVLEDAHAGDSAGLALAAHIGPRLARARILLLITARTGAVGESVVRARAGLARQGAVLEEIHLAPLGLGDVLSIVRGAAPGLDPEIAARVAEGAAGSPLLALRAARAAAAGADPEEAVCDAVRAPVAGLSEPARLLVAVAAVAGRGLTLREVTSAVGARTADAAIEEAVAAGLLDIADGRVVFAHDLLRRACHAELPAARRRAAHAAMAEALSGAGSRAPAEVAHHLRGAGDEERARTYLRAAATAARALGALDQAAAFLRDVALSAHGAGDAAAEGDAWIALAEIQAWRGDRDALDAAFARGRAALEAAGDIAGLAAALAERGRWLRTTTCFPPEVFRCSREAVELLDRAGIHAPETRLLAFAGMAWGEAVAGDPVRGARLHEAVGAMLRETPDPVLRCEHLITRAFALLRIGDSAAAREVCAEAAALADECGEPALGLDARVAQATSAAYEGLFEEVVRILDEAPDAVRVGPTLACQSLAGRAHALSRLGRHDEAVAAAREQVAVARGLATADVEATAAADLGAVLLAAGRPDEALAVLEGVLSDGAQRVPRAATRILAVEAALATGDPSRAAGHLDRFPFDPVRAGDQPETLVARLDRVSGLVRIAAGDIAGGVALLDEAAGRWSVLAADTRPAGATAQDVLGVMIDLGRAPVAGLTEPARELERLHAERARAIRALAASSPEVV
jgi:tetratricopeptide (TPR) repeat protein